LTTPGTAAQLKVAAPLPTGITDRLVGGLLQQFVKIVVKEYGRKGKATPLIYGVTEIFDGELIPPSLTKLKFGAVVAIVAGAGDPPYNQPLGTVPIFQT
jgi:hypothetical protein